MVTTFKEVETARQAYLKKIWKYCLIGGVSLVAITILSLGAFLVLWPATLFLVALFFYLAFGSKERANYYKIYKAYFVEKGLRKVFELTKYDHALGINKSVLDAVGMINTGDRYSSNDYVAGRYKDARFEQADVHIETETRDSNGNVHYYTIFRGRWMIFEFPKKFDFRLEVVEKGFRAARTPKNGRGFERVEVESPEFNQLFRIYAEDGFEMFYLLDPSLIHNITEIGQKYKGKLLLCFVDNKLHIGMDDRKDAFEPPNVFSKLNEDTENAKISEDMHLITNFVDKLKLVKKIFQ